MPSSKKYFPLTALLFFISFCGFNPAWAEAEQSGKNTSSIDAKIKAYKKQLSNLNAQYDKHKEDLSIKRADAALAMHESENELKKKELRVIQLERDADRLTNEIRKIEDENKKLIKDFDNLNVFQQGLERSKHKDVLSSNESKITLIRFDLDKINESLKGSRTDVDNTRRVYESQKKLSNVFNEENNPKILKLQQSIKNISQQLKKAEREKSSQLKTVKAPKKVEQKKVEQERVETAVTVDTNHQEKAWVYIVNGERIKNLGDLLGMEDWLKSFDVKYIETNWGRMVLGTEKGISQGFVKQFRADLGRMPKESKLILIGHGLGGGAAILAATEVANAEGKSIDLLVALDPVGVNKLRTNIVYQPSAPCPLPGSDEARLAYFVCMDAAKPRWITPNVKFFYNRWQKNGGVASDKHRGYRISDAEGNLLVLPTSTGKFAIKSNTTKSDQKRFFHKDLVKKDQSLIVAAGKELPNLLVEYLQ